MALDADAHAVTGVDIELTRPRRYWIRMTLFLALVVVGIALVLPRLQEAFVANIFLNGMIVGTLVLGLVFTYRQVLMLGPEVSWIEGYRRARPTLSDAQPRLLGPVANMLNERRLADPEATLMLTPAAMRSLLDSIGSRLEEQRDIARYLIGLLVFLGLLGTFWGLLGVINSVSDTIQSLSAEGDVGNMFNELKNSLSGPLGGMGTAFSSSLFGLAGSLILGFLELQAAQAQNRFYNELEEWMSTVTRLSAPPPGTAAALTLEGEAAVPTYLQALIEQTAESLLSLQRTIGRSEESRVSAQNAMVTLVEKLSNMSDQMYTEQTLMRRLAENQLDLKASMERIASAGESAFGFDEATRAHIRNIDGQLGRIAEDAEAGRTEMLEELRREIKMLARTVAALVHYEDKE